MLGIWKSLLLTCSLFNAFYANAASAGSASTLTRYGGWLPANPAVHDSFIHHHVQRANTLLSNGEGHTDAVRAFEMAIKSDPEMVKLFDQIFLQASKENKITNFDLLLYALDNIVKAAPAFHIARDDHGNVIGEPIGVPMYLIFDLLSNTGAAYDLFRKPAFNHAMKKLLDSWGEYLTTPSSTNTLTHGPEGWFGSTGLQSLEANGRGDFNATWVIPDPKAVNKGYASWDDFFTRKFRPGVRPIIRPKDKSLLISACESTTFRIAKGVKEHDRFWLKGQPYSLYDMLGGDKATARSFAGGTVYQAFLSPQDYHRWHSPIDGTIVRAEILPGSYYAVLPDEGAPKNDTDLKPGDPHGALIRSQAWLTMHSTRAVIYIQADNPKIGLMAFIAVGMAEVSTCEISVHKGQKVKKGTELGMFHFGGSTHAMVFGPNAKIAWADKVKVDAHQKLHSVLAQFQ